MLCQCGNRIPDNAVRCPYCGKKNNRMRSRPDSLIHAGRTFTPEHDIPEFEDNGPTKEDGFVRNFLHFILVLAVLVGMCVLFGIGVTGAPLGFFRELVDMGSYLTTS